MDSFQTELDQEPAAPEQNKPGILRVLVDIIETLVLSALLFAGINVISARIRVDGHSMLPTLNTGEFVIVNKLAYKIGSPKYGDIIVFHFPRDPEQEYIKRVIGLPGDRVVIANKNVQVNGTVLDEPYVAAPPLYEADWTVPENSLFVLGDNRNNSSDSHNWGPVPMDYVVGKALFIYWPLDKWGFLGAYSTSSPGASGAQDSLSVVTQPMDSGLSQSPKNDGFGVKFGRLRRPNLTPNIFLVKALPMDLPAGGQSHLWIPSLTSSR